jgi:biopolymer transport protein ExbD
MPKIKVAKSSPSLDMTPMVDLAFLLVTFFMLTATMRAPEPVLVDTPSSISETELPNNTMLVTIDTAGRVFFNVDGKEVREKMLARMMNKFPEVKFTQKQIDRFKLMKSFGVPFEQLPAYIDADEVERKKIDTQTKGIPIDTVDNKDQLTFWINFGRVEAFIWNKDQVDNKGAKDKPMRFAIKCDGKAQYRKVDAIIELFKKQDIFRFNLITDLESAAQ